MNDTTNTAIEQAPTVADKPELDLTGFLPKFEDFDEATSETATIAPLPSTTATEAVAAYPADGDEEELLEPTDEQSGTDLVEAAKEAPLKPLAQTEVVDDAPKGITLRQKVIAGVAAVAALVAGVVLFAGKTSAPVVVKAPPVAVTPAPVTPAPTATPGVPAAPGSVEIFHTADSPDSAARLESETAADLQPWPANQRTCDAPGLAGYDRDVCAKEGPAVYFRCAPDGRRWDISLPGCDRG